MKLDEAKLVELQDSSYEVTLDDRLRLRLPDDLVDRLATKLQEAGHTVPVAKGKVRLSFYLAPGPEGRIFIYPEPNYAYATWCVEHPPKHVDRKRAQKVRRFFYGHVKFVENDSLGRMVIPERLRNLAGIDGDHRKVVLVPQRYFYELTTEEAFEQTMTEDVDAFDVNGEDILNPFDAPFEQEEDEEHVV